MTTDLPHSPAADRNKDAILGVMQRLLPPDAAVLEVASGTDADADALAGIARRCAALPNVRPPLLLDVVASPWPLQPDARFDAVFSANMLHISPWATCAGLMRGAATHLVPGGQLLIYGPFIVDDAPTAPSNLAFDADLRARNPAWGLRRLPDVIAAAAGAGLDFRERIPMPANNLMLVFQLR
jgi:hypothetical protein